MSRKDRTITGEEFERLVRHVQGYADTLEDQWKSSRKVGLLREARKAARDVVAYRLMGEAGLRVGEIVKLVFGNVHLQGQWVEVLRIGAGVAKGGHEREIPLSQGCNAALVRYSELLGFERDWHGQAFGGNWDMSLIGLSVRQVERRVRFHTKTLLGRELHPHVFRHFCANRWRRATGDPYVVQKLLGHVRLETTMRYTRVDGVELARAVQRAAELVD